ncbi:junctional sarcoplasmic reticulum protein 1-like isoform X1 [Acipenser ruthenus]|uniref:junctional sarcoplasmic reticulum protein 1-like isoform X1 n=1 Tax=Acipenser ruthenus TaxID=7906 RepID=UPI00145A10DD|nr:junctional sarcoplasmic reticulum protein 1-like isoform X1 [Acipenser ruthenus]XP_034767741.2 junctional sarcoplasmic reticulum protein 1-like isoform X1 [Acipenser ruthenus]
MDESTFETFEGDIGPEEGLEELPAPGEILPKTTKQLRNQGAQIAKTSKGESSGVSREVEGFQTVEQELVQAQETALPSNPHPAKEKAKPAVPEKPARKAEPSAEGPVCAEEPSPWNGITLNRCLVVATVIVLVSMGFQTLQEAITSDDEVSDPESDLLSWSDSNPVEDKTEQPESSFFGSLMWWSWVPEEEDSEEAAAGGRRSESRGARALGRRDQEQEAGGRGRAEKHRVRRRAEGIRELLKSKEEKGGHDKAGRKHEEKPPKQREQKQAEHKRSEQKRDERKRREDSDDDKNSGSKGNRMSLLADKGMPKKERGKYQLKGGKRND